MRSDTPGQGSDPHRNPEAKISAALATGLGLQLTSLVLPSIVIVPTIVFRAAGETEVVVLWTVFVSVVICGVTTILQSIRLGHIGSGYIVATGTSGAGIAVSIAALQSGGMALLATMVVAMALFQLLISAKLLLFRRVLTPTVTGVVMMLTPVTVMPFIFQQLDDVPAGAPEAAAPLTALVTLAVMGGLVLKGSAPVRLWSPIIGIAAGAAVAGAFGIYDAERFAAAPWIGIPQPVWAGFDLEFGPEFWGLLPAFLFIALVCTILTISGAVTIQRVSWERPRAVDFRAVQGAVGAEGAGNVLAGIAAIAPIGFRPAGAAMVELTGVSSRYIGIALGAVLIVVAFFPKALAVILVMPGPIVSAFVTVMMATIFLIGMKMIVQDGVDHRKGFIAGVAFWIGVGFENGVVFPEQLLEFAGGVLQNGMMTGGLVAVVLTMFVEMARPRRSRTEVEFDLSALEKIRAFLVAFVGRSGWGPEMAERLDAVGEETLLTLMRHDEAKEERKSRRLTIEAKKEDGKAILEFVASTGGDNVQDRIALLGEEADEAGIEREASLRLLRHLASSVHHQQYHDTDIVTVRVAAPGSGNRAGL